MRLVNTLTLKLYEFHDRSIPPYAILSHTWGEEEVTLQDLEKPSSKVLLGHKKITSCCALARSDGWNYVWIDTCCIDKTSSVELSEAINSMYRWYQNAEVCYAYMADVTVEPRSPGGRNRFCKSRWFTRGWTLQELLAPDTVVFYDSHWKELGTKLSLQAEVVIATNILREDLENPREASVAAKMSWAAARETTRVEDVAYCLMGLFDVNMPLLYGEGPRAFKRLQELILQHTSDESIFAWRDPYLSVSGMLAQAPDAFVKSGDVVPISNSSLPRRPLRMTNMGLEMDICFGRFPAVPDLREIMDIRRYGQWMVSENGDFPAVLLNCVRKGFPDCRLFILLKRRSEESYVRICVEELPSLEAAAGEARTLREFHFSNPSRGYVETRNEVYSGDDLKNVIRTISAPNNSGQNMKRPHFSLKDYYDYVARTYESSLSRKHHYVFPLVVVSPWNHGFSFARMTIDGFTAWTSFSLKPRDDLGGWQISDDLDRELCMFRNTLGENFILEVNGSGTHAEFKVYVPAELDDSVEQNAHMIDFLEIEASLAFTTATDRLPEVLLQASSAVCLRINKKLLAGRVCHVLEINLLRRGCLGSG